MKKTIGFSLAVLLVTLTSLFLVAKAADLDLGPKVMDLNAQERYGVMPGVPKRDRKKVSKFTHRLHQEKHLKGNSKYAHFKYTDEFTCKGCHHMAEPGDQPQSCFRCKDFQSMIEKVGGRFENIFHRDCRDGCHMAMMRAGEYAGPTSCRKCHDRK